MLGMAGCRSSTRSISRLFCVIWIKYGLSSVLSAALFIAVVIDNSDPLYKYVERVGTLRWIRAPTKCVMKCKNTIKFWLDKYLLTNVFGNFTPRSYASHLQHCSKRPRSILMWTQKKKEKKSPLSLVPFGLSAVEFRIARQLSSSSLSSSSVNAWSVLVRVYFNFAPAFSTY